MAEHTPAPGDSDAVREAERILRTPEDAPTDPMEPDPRGADLLWHLFVQSGWRVEEHHRQPGEAIPPSPPNAITLRGAPPKPYAPCGAAGCPTQTQRSPWDAGTLQPLTLWDDPDTQRAYGLCAACAGTAEAALLEGDSIALRALLDGPEAAEAARAKMVAFWAVDGARGPQRAYTAEEFRQHYAAFLQTDGRKSRLRFAQQLGIDESTVRQYLRRLGLPWPTSSRGGRSGAKKPSENLPDLHAPDDGQPR